MTDSGSTEALRKWIKLMFDENIEALAASVDDSLGPVNIIETGNIEEDVDSIDYHYVDQIFDEEFYENLKSGKFWQMN